MASQAPASAMRPRRACQAIGAAANPKLLGKGVRHRRAFVAEARERADWAAERGDQNAGLEPGQLLGDLGDAQTPDRGLVAEGDRGGMLAIRAPDARSRCGAAGPGPRGLSRLL